MYGHFYAQYPPGLFSGRPEPPTSLFNPSGHLHITLSLFLAPVGHSISSIPESDHNFSAQPASSNSVVIPSAVKLLFSFLASERFTVSSLTLVGFRFLNTRDKTRVNIPGNNFSDNPRREGEITAYI